jgi:chromosomal replication initiation ATPase DnaA
VPGKSALAMTFYEGQRVPKQACEVSRSDSCNSSGRRAERIMEVCEGLIDICAALFNVSSKEIRQTGRTGQDAARVRQIAMYVAHAMLGLSQNSVARGFARDRGTVRYACMAIECLRGMRNSTEPSH